MAELWTTHPEKAKAQIKMIAPGHKRSELVAHGFEQWWIGPGLNDFDEHLIQACRNRKRKFRQPDSASDAKTFINNMIRNEDWGNFSLRCEEAIALQRQSPEPIKPSQAAAMPRCSPFKRTEAERRSCAMGLAQFKLSKGLVAQAAAIAQQFGFVLPGLEGAIADSPFAIAA